MPRVDLGDRNESGLLHFGLGLGWRAAFLVGLALVAVEHRAHAIAACGDGEGWALAPGATLPTHPHLVYYIDGRRTTGPQKPTITATIAGATVPVKLSFLAAPPFQLAMLEVDSDKPGALVLTWGEGTKDNGYFQPSERTAAYTISAKLKLPAQAKGTSTRFHKAYHHSTVHEIDDGLEIAVDVPAIAFTARWRTSDKDTWSTLEMTASTVDGHQVARLGSLGCSANFQTTLLERGIDLELSALLPDGKKVVVAGLPAHVVLAPLPKTAPQSSP